MLINRSGTMVLPYLSLYMTQHLHFSVRQAGIVLAIYGLGALLGTFLGGRLTDRTGFYWIQFGSLFFGGLMLLVLQFVTRFEWLCVVVFVFTALGDSFRPANAAALAHYSPPDSRTRAYSLNRLAINLGWAVGGGLGGLLAGIDYQLLFWADGMTCIGAALYLLFALPRPDPGGAVRRTNVDQSAGAGDGSARPPHGQPMPAIGAADYAPTRSPWRDGLFLLFIGCVVAYATAFMQFFSMVPLYLKQVMGLREAQIGLLNTVNGLLIVAVEMVFVYWFERRFRERLGISALGVGLTAVSLLVLTVPTLPGLVWVWVLLFTGGEMLAHPFLLSFVANRADDRNRGAYMGLNSMAWATAQIGSPFIGAQVAERFGFNTLWLLLAGLCVLSAAGLWWVRGQNET